MRVESVRVRNVALLVFCVGGLSAAHAKEQPEIAGAAARAPRRR